jgi:periplasmic divalent cation tolerance protein
MADKLIQISTAISSEQEAQQIARSLVEKKLTNCVQVVGPVVSTFRWQGEIKESAEWLCLIKAEEYNFEQIEQVIKALHSYELPEIIATPIIRGSQEYIDWLTKP